VSKDKYGTSVERNGKNIVMVIDSETGEWLLDALYALGEHIAAGARIDPMPAEANNRLGSLLSQLTSVVMEVRRNSETAE
jgi:hypothetical protein